MRRVVKNRDMHKPEESMKRVTLAAFAVAGLVLLGYGTPRAAGELDSNPEGTSGDVPSHRFGTSGNIATKKRLEEWNSARYGWKYHHSVPRSGTGAREEPSSSGQE